MGFLQNPIPEPSATDSGFSHERETNTLRALKESTDRLLSLIEQLDQFSVLPIVSAENMRIYRCLAIDSGESDASASTPFHIHTKKNGQSYYAGVSNFSRVYTSVHPDSFIPITGLLSEAPTPNDPNWFQIKVGDLIWIQADVSGSVISNARIEHTGSTAHNLNLSATLWSKDSGAIVEDNGGTFPAQTKLRALVARVIDDGSGKPTIQQEMDRHQITRFVLMANRPAVYLSDFRGAIR